MPPKDPLLGALKVCILNLQTEEGTVTDVNPHLSSCCELLELTLRKGLQQPVLGLVHRDYWQCFEQLLQHDNCGRYLSGRVFVLKLLPGSQAQVDKCVHPGDIIDEINGVSLRNACNGQAGVVLSGLKGHPLSLRVLRWCVQDGGVYRPIIKLLRALREENPALQLGPSPSSQEPTNQGQRPTPSQCLKEGRQIYSVQFLGKTNIGMYGGKEVLQNGIPLVIQQNQPSMEVLLDLKETHLICTEKSNMTELFQHHYPEISCVGRFGQPDYTIFAFCVVESPETPQSTGFCCVVLRASAVKECEEIVNRIAIGFKHTEWFV
ncbi:unnamed protein product [Oncorhynchus mykiss]|uniref:PDZ domain-containing protein n=1 Tax=Oncorhynchus mykiss TaxID=8022 RepID=A0A060X5A2_ONCMY|nr:unnamed protein product [Oncorhynchus mykiss]